MTRFLFLSPAAQSLECRSPCTSCEETPGLYKNAAAQEDRERTRRGRGRLAVSCLAATRRGARSAGRSRAPLRVAAKRSPCLRTLLARRLHLLVQQLHQLFEQFQILGAGDDVQALNQAEEMGKGGKWCQFY